jgi:hypothetical protein
MTRGLASVWVGAGATAVSIGLGCSGGDVIPAPDTGTTLDGGRDATHDVLPPPPDGKRPDVLVPDVGPTPPDAEPRDSAPETAPDVYRLDLDADVPGPVSDVAVDTYLSPDAACTSVAQSATRVQASVLFVLDRSGSMNCPADRDPAACEANPTKESGKSSKWDLLVSALGTTLSDLPADSAIGVRYFDLSGRQACGDQSPNPDIPLKGNDATHRSAIMSSLGAIVPSGTTPIAYAMGHSLENMTSATSLVGKRFVVLVTDGREQCDPQALSALLADTEGPNVRTAAKSFDVRTFVVGVPGSQMSRSQLSTMAYRGGTARSAGCNYGSASSDVGDCHYDLSQAGLNLGPALRDALSELAYEPVSCESPVPSEVAGVPVDRRLVNVRYFPRNDPSAPEAFSRRADAQSCGTAASAFYFSADGTSLVLCPSTCTRVRSDPKARWEAALACEAIKS